MSAAQPRRIAIAIDDVGLHPGICDAVLELAQIGRVQAAGCMVGGDRWAADAARLRSLPRSRTELGLHLDLTELPQRMPPARRLPLLWLTSYLHSVPRSALIDEIDAQLDAFENAIGRTPDFVDGHQHVHQLPVVREVLLERLTLRCATGAKPWVRACRRPSAGPGGAPAEKAAGKPRGEAVVRRAFKPWLIERLGASALASAAAAGGFAQNRALLGSYDFKGGAQRYGLLVETWLAAASDGDLLMTHAATRPCAADGLSAARPHEFEVLAGAGFEAALLAHGVTLATIGEIRAAIP